jgi:hypothetical protein
LSVRISIVLNRSAVVVVSEGCDVVVEVVADDAVVVAVDVVVVVVVSVVGVVETLVVVVDVETVDVAVVVETVTWHAARNIVKIVIRIHGKRRFMRYLRKMGSSIISKAKEKGKKSLPLIVWNVRRC